MVLPAQSYDYLQNLQDSLRTNYQQGKTGNLNLPGMGLDVLGAGAQTLGAYDRAVTPFAESAVKNLRGLAPKTLGPDVSRFARMAGNPRMLGAFKALPALAGLGAVTSAGDILLNNTGVNDAGQDAAGMGLGAGIGFMLGGGPIGAVIGAGLGKPVMDLTQEAGKMIFGSDEDRKLKEALALLQQRGMA